MGSSIIPGILGAVGLLQANKQQKAQTNAVKKAGKASERISNMQFDVMEMLKQLSDNYDPAKETADATEFGKKQAGATLERSLAGVRTRYGGGNPSGDTNFHVSAQNATDSVLGPLAAWSADRKASETARKAGLYQAVLGVPAGQLRDSYFKTAALTPGGNPAGSAMMLAQSLQGLFGNQNPQNNSLGAQAGGSDASTGGGAQVIDWSFLRNIR